MLKKKRPFITIWDNMNPIKAVPVLFVALLLSLGAKAQETISLRQALEIARANNLQVKQAAFQSSLSELEVKQAKMNFFPTLNAGVSSGVNWGSYFDPFTAKLNTASVSSLNGSANTSAVIFQGLQRINLVSANKYLLLADQSNIEKVKNDLDLAVVTTYIEALTNQDLAIASQQQLKLSKQQLEVERINFDVGKKTQADLSQAISQVAIDESNLTTTQNLYDLSILNLKQLMEMDPNTAIILEIPVLPDIENMESEYTAQQVFNSALMTFPEIEVAKYNAEAAKKNIAIAKGGYYPTLSLSGGISTGYSSTATEPLTNERMGFGRQLNVNRGESIGLSLSIPIFNNFRTRIGVSKAKISYENALVSEQRAKNDLNKVINQAVLDLKAADGNYTSKKLVFESLREAFNVINQRYEVGLANSIELSTAQLNMNRAEFEFITAKYNMIFRSKVIDFYLGKSISFN